ncbi:MAG: hypothetical protein PVG50_00810 [Thiohalophilus sp.]|jgi:hypothetical protein
MTVTARRLYLSLIVKLLFAAGLLALAVVLLASLSSGDTSNGPAVDPWRLKVDWSDMSPGEYRTLTWPNGQRIGIYRRLAQEMTVPEPASSPEGDTGKRSREVFVFFPNENLRSCRVSPVDTGQGRFTEPCFGARFDADGRRIAGTGVEGQQDLKVPDYVLIGARRLQLQPPGAGR